MDLNKIVSDNIGLVHKQLSRFYLCNDPDALSIGLNALLTAAKTYDTSKNCKFSTYATVCIYNALGMYLRQLNRKTQIKTVSYYNTVEGTDDVYYIDIISDGTTPEDTCLESELHSKLWSAFDKLYSELPSDAERVILGSWRRSDFTKSQVDLAKEAGVSQAHVSRTLSAFKHKLKKELEEYLC